MKHAALLLALLSGGCETFTNRYGPESQATRAVYSEAGGVASIFTGRVSSCTLVESKGQPVKITKLVFDEDTCTIEATAE